MNTLKVIDEMEEDFTQNCEGIYADFKEKKQDLIERIRDVINAYDERIDKLR